MKIVKFITFEFNKKEIMDALNKVYGVPLKGFISMEYIDTEIQTNSTCLKIEIEEESKTSE